MYILCATRRPQIRKPCAHFVLANICTVSGLHARLRLINLRLMMNKVCMGGWVAKTTTRSKMAQHNAKYILLEKCASCVLISFLEQIKYCPGGLATFKFITIN
jgi:hypothetical protein